MTKCTEAAALREAFPDEIGGEGTEEEMAGRIVEIVAAEVTRALKPETVAPRAKQVAHTPAETTRANFVETAQAQPETVTAQKSAADENGEFKSLASEELAPPEDEAGSRG
jgi:hypothetical protein